MDDHSGMSPYPTSKTPVYDLNQLTLEAAIRGA